MSKIDYSWPQDAEIFQHDDVSTSHKSSMWRSSYVGSENDMPAVVTRQMLKEHTAKVDAWIVIDGVAWDVAGFLDRHPGGLEPIGKGLGRDATKLFNKVHPQVYPGDHIGVVFVGIYLPRDSSPVPVKKQRLSNWLSVQCFNVCHQVEKSYFTAQFYDTDDFIVLEVTDHPSRYIKSSAWSWILSLHNQKTFAVTVHMLPGFCRRAEFTLKEEIETDFLYFKFLDEFKKVTVLFKKLVPEKRWKSFGDPSSDTNDVIVASKDVMDETRCHLFFRKKLTSSVYMVGLKIRPSTYMKVPPGFWIKVSAEGAHELYYPVSYSLLEEGDPSLETSVSGEPIYLLISLFHESHVSQLLCSEGTDESVTDATLPYIKTGIPSTSFDISFLEDLDVLVLLARDLGIAPIINIIAYFKEKDRTKGLKERVFLIYCNRSPKDVIWLEEWSALSESHFWFHPFLLVNEPDSNWKELQGNLSAYLTKACLHSIPGVHAGLKIKAICSGDEAFLSECLGVFEDMEDYFDDTCTISELSRTIKK